MADDGKYDFSGIMKDEYFDFEVDLDKLLDRTYFVLKRNNLNLAEAVERGREKAYKRIAEDMAKKVQERLTFYGLRESGILETQVDFVYTDQGVSMLLKDGYAIFVEFGTGIRGQTNTPTSRYPASKRGQHPRAEDYGWKYDTNKHGENGWWYPTDSSDPNPNITQNKLGEWFGWTKGQSSRPFMYDTWKWTSQRATQIMQGAITKELKILERKAKINDN